MTVYIHRSQCSVRFLNLPSVNSDEIKNMLAFEIANMFPLKSEELVWDFVSVDKLASGYSRVMLVACQKDGLNARLAAATEAEKGAGQKHPGPGIGFSTLSLFNQFVQKIEPAASVLCVHIEQGQFELFGIRGRKLVFSRGLVLEGTGEQSSSIIARETGYSLKLMQEEGAIEKIVVSAVGEDAQLFADEIQRAAGLPVEVLKGISIAAGHKYESAKESLRIDLLPAEIKEERVKAKRLRTLLYFGGLLLLNLSLVANLAFMQMKAKVQYLAILKAQTNDISPKALALQKKMLKAQVLSRYVNSSRMALRIMTEVYKLAPSGVSLNSLDIAEGQTAGALVIVGQANDSESVLKYADALKNANLLRKAEVTYVTKRAGSAVQLFDFEIRASY